MKRRSFTFFALLAAPLTLLWPRSKPPKQTKPSPAEVFGATHEAGIEFQVSFASQEGIIRISKTSAPKSPSHWVGITRHKTIGVLGGPHTYPTALSADEIQHIYKNSPYTYEEGLREAANWLASSMTPEEKERYLRCLAKGGCYGE